ncbi:MAG: DUF354 domain-containing protein [Thaumarchaeota archaeon]|nr:DUF354 domain-containing protein [Nitrososphaerota archaeon]
MKVWVDILTPKQALFFEPLIKELSLKNDVLVTSRKYREVELIMEKRGIAGHFIGEHGGKDLYRKLVASAERIRKLADLVSKEEPDIAVSFSSPECCRVAFGLGIKNYCITDSPHAAAVARLTVPLCDELFTPWVIPTRAWTKYGIAANNITKYRALDPAAWLKRVDRSKRRPEVKVEKGKKTIVVRLEESFAAYLLETSNKKQTQGYQLLAKLVKEFSNCNIVALGRYSEQIEILQKNFDNKIIVPDNIVDGIPLLMNCDIFIGMGGTMTAEAALLGVPTVSFFRGTYDIERFLIRKGLVLKPKNVDDVVKVSKKLLADDSRRKVIKAKAAKLLGWMEDPVKVICAKIQAT